jgi:hypothetical protein
VADITPFLNHNHVYTSNPTISQANQTAQIPPVQKNILPLQNTYQADSRRVPCVFGSCKKVLTHTWEFYAIDPVIIQQRERERKIVIENKILSLFTKIKYNFFIFIFNSKLLEDD